MSILRTEGPPNRFVTVANAPRPWDASARRFRSRTVIRLTVVGAMLLALTGYGITAATAAGAGKALKAAATSTGKALKGGTITFAESPSDAPDYILPLYDLANYDLSNSSELQPLLYMPLYFYGTGDQPTLNESMSLANLPVYSNGDRTVTITLKKGTKWSDGKPVTSRDVEFWNNLLVANKDNYGPYAPGTYPDNVTSFAYPNADTIVMHLDASYNPEWFTEYDLSEITPLPQASWDKTSTSGPVGNYDMSASGAVRVYNFLNKQAENVLTYASNPLWQVVDGPWKLQQYTAEGQLTFVPNRAFTGPGPAAKLSKFVEVPFTSEVSENNALLTGSVDYGYISVTDAPEIPRLEALGYKVVPWPIWGVNYLYVNYSNPTSGPFMDQTYVRVAMQELTNQPELIKTIYHGYAYPTYGGVPVVPKTSYASPAELKNLYPYDPNKAIASLRSHGWKIIPNGASVCTDPKLCGAGIKAGSTLTVVAIFPTGYPEIEDMMEAMASAWSAAGIKMELRGLSNDAIGALLGPCKAGSACGWGFIDYETAYYWQPPSFPDGSRPFGVGSISTGGTPPFLAQMDNYINAVRVAPADKAQQALDAYEAYVQKVAPQVWLPMMYNQISVIRDNIGGATPQNPLAGQILPQEWYLTNG